MFGFFKKKNTQAFAYTGFPVHTDIHSHILPGIDDGSPDVETSLQLIKGIVKLGITKSVATPHIIGDLYRNTPEIINDKLTLIKEACIKEDIAIELTAAAEYMLDSNFLSLLRNGDTLLTIQKNIILTEQSYAVPTGNLEDIAFEIITNGYKPIMAHPERYFFYHNKPDDYYRLKELGFLLQVNLLSLTGYYGKEVAKAGRFLFKKDLVDLVGTDMHHEKHLGALSHPKNIELMYECIGDKVYNDLFTI